MMNRPPIGRFSMPTQSFTPVSASQIRVVWSENSDKAIRIWDTETGATVAKLRDVFCLFSCGRHTIPDSGDI